METKELEQHYRELEQSFKLQRGPSPLAESVTASGNTSLPIHRWFRFKEGFSADLLTHVGVAHNQLDGEEAVFLDPFCGSGTTILAGDIQFGWKAQRVGVEVNPFLAFVARTKASWRGFRASRLRTTAHKLLAKPLAKDIPPDGWPALSSLHRDDLFPAYRVSALVDAISRAEAVHEPERDLLLLGIAAATDRLGYYRKDGRALRILRAAGELKERNSLQVEDVLREIWEEYSNDLEDLEALSTKEVGVWEIREDDGRRLAGAEDGRLRAESISLIAYSPPYLNHIDYTEVYKIELWLLGFVRDSESMLRLRKSTVRSHASVGVVEVAAHFPERVDRTIELAAQYVEAAGTKWHQSFRRLLRAYLLDMQEALKAQFQLLERGGQVICVVGNSGHGAAKSRVPIATDLLLALIAESVGFDVPDIVIARQLRRRDHLNRYLRESVLTFKRPAH